MNTPTKLGAYAGGLAVAFAAAFAVGSAAAPIDMGFAMDSKTSHGGHAEGAVQTTLPGLAVAQDGYTLVPATTTLAAADSTPFRFTVTGPDGRPVTSYTQTHTKDLHLIVVRRDMAGFQHVHPTLAADGNWSVPLDLAAAGTYRVFADFKPAAHEAGLTLGTDIAVAGAYEPTPLPAPQTSTSVDGYDVALDGTAKAGNESGLTFTISKEGAKVTDLQPYLGAFGHLVSLRTGDLAYLHTHPGQEASAGQRGGPAVQFATTFPTAGTYRLFLDFQAGGAVHTAEFTVIVPAEPDSGRS